MKLAAFAMLFQFAAGCGTSQPIEPPADFSRSSARENGAADAHPASATPRPDDWFENLTEASGVRFTYRNGEDAGLSTILETVGGGVAMIDFDRDGDLDLFFPGGGEISADPPRVSGRPCGMFRNDGSFRFTDVSRETGVSEITADYSHGAVAADFDRDGWPDLFLTCFGRSRLLHNEGGRRFADVTNSSGLVVDGWSTAAAWGDVDRDGRPDLFVAGYVEWKLDPQEACIDPESGLRDACPPQRYAPARQRLFRNRGGGAFEEVTQKATLRTDGKALGVVAADVNRDGYVDFYVANDQVLNHLYLGGAEWPLAEVGEKSGTAFNEYGAAEGSMGVDYGDFDGDGRGDLFVTNFELEDNSLYRNLGGGSFLHATVAAGLGGQGRTLVGWGTAFADFDSDGWLDLLTVNGHVFRHRGQSPYRQPAFILRNHEGKRFQSVDEAGDWFRASHAGRGGAVGDLDNDGAPDLVIVSQNEPVAILRNRRRPAFWARLELRGESSDPDAIGAEVERRFSGRTLIRSVRSGGGYLSQSDPRILLPLDTDNPVDVTVHWLGGPDEVFRGLAPGRTHLVRQGTGEVPP